MRGSARASKSMTAKPMARLSRRKLLTCASCGLFTFKSYANLQHLTDAYGGHIVLIPYTVLLLLVFQPLLTLEFAIGAYFRSNLLSILIKTSPSLGGLVILLAIGHLLSMTCTASYVSDVTEILIQTLNAVPSWIPSDSYRLLCEQLPGAEQKCRQAIGCFYNDGVCESDALHWAEQRLERQKESPNTLVAVVSISIMWIVIVLCQGYHIRPPGTFVATSTIASFIVLSYFCFGRQHQDWDGTEFLPAGAPALQTKVAFLTAALEGAEAPSKAAAKAAFAAASILSRTGAAAASAAAASAASAAAAATETSVVFLLNPTMWLAALNHGIFHYAIGTGFNVMIGCLAAPEENLSVLASHLTFIDAAVSGGFVIVLSFITMELATITGRSVNVVRESMPDILGVALPAIVGDVAHKIFILRALSICALVSEVGSACIMTYLLIENLIELFPRWFAKAQASEWGRSPTSSMSIAHWQGATLFLFVAYPVTLLLSIQQLIMVSSALALTFFILIAFFECMLMGWLTFSRDQAIALGHSAVNEYALLYLCLSCIGGSVLLPALWSLRQSYFDSAPSWTYQILPAVLITLSLLVAVILACTRIWRAINLHARECGEKSLNLSTFEVWHPAKIPLASQLSAHGRLAWLTVGNITLLKQYVTIGHWAPVAVKYSCPFWLTLALFEAAADLDATTSGNIPFHQAYSRSHSLYDDSTLQVPYTPFVLYAQYLGVLAGPVVVVLSAIYAMLAPRLCPRHPFSTRFRRTEVTKYGLDFLGQIRSSSLQQQFSYFNLTCLRAFIFMEFRKKHKYFPKENKLADYRLKLCRDTYHQVLGAEAATRLMTVPQLDALLHKRMSLVLSHVYHDHEDRNRDRSHFLS